MDALAISRRHLLAFKQKKTLLFFVDSEVRSVGFARLVGLGLKQVS